MDEESSKYKFDWGRFYRAVASEDLCDKVSTWYKIGDTYKCGNCGRITFFVDIMDRNICYNCQHIMRFAEVEDGLIAPLKYEYRKDDEAPMPKFETY